MVIAEWPPAWAKRYTADPELVDFALNDLPGLSYDDAHEFYADFLARDPLDGEVAILGLADRYFLLTALLNRIDMLEATEANPKGKTEKAARWLYERCREVELEPDGFLDLWSREHYKSTIITFGGVLQEILRDPEITIGIFSNTRPNAKKPLRQVKGEFEDNHRLKVLYSDILWANPKVDSPKWSEQDGIVVRRKGNPKEATLEAWGLVDGLPVGPHFKLRVYDDTVTKESVNTPEQVKKTTEAYEHSTNLGADDGREWDIGTRYGLADTYKTLLDRKTLKPRIYPATANGLSDGEPIFWSKELWEKKKRDQPTTFAAQLLQNPAAGPQRVFDLKTFKTWQVRPRTLRIYIIVDPAKGPAHKEVGRDRDRTAMAVIGVDTANKFYLLDGYRHRMTLGERWEALKSLRRKWMTTRGVVDVQIGYEQYGLQSDLEYFERMMQLESKSDKANSFTIDELAWPREGSGAKEDRIARLVPDIISGRFLLPFLVWHEGMTAEITLPDGTKFEAKGIARWEAPKGEAEFSPHVGPTAQMRRAIDSGLPDTVCTEVKRLDENKAVYDLTRDFLEEAMFFPFGSHDDLLDACSRIYDMEPTPPKIYDADVFTPTVYVDGV